MNELSDERRELLEVENKPIMLQDPGTRMNIEFLANEGESEFVRNKARGLLNAVPCANCVDE